MASGLKWDVKVVDGDSLLAKPAEVKQWRYKPALRNGKPVAVQVTVGVAFTLKAVQ
jgi:Gram-negative bacterial TonB protein C-terminal